MQLFTYALLKLFTSALYFVEEMRGLKSDLRNRLGDLLHATVHINVANKDDDNDDDELAAQPPVPKPVT